MAGLTAYLACTVAIAALACGHQGQDWPLSGAWRVLCARLRGVGGVRVRREGRGAPEAVESRLRLRAARDARPEPPVTGPSRPRSRRCGAPQATGGGFPTPTRQRASQSRSRPSWAHTQPINYEEAA